ncbi:MAG: acetyl-CoA carboxylase biotin carboxyl carrier protein [Candidatus Omnitrophota bacterium]
MDIKEIKELINLMNDHNLVEIEIEKEGKKIRLKKDSLYGSTGPVIIKEKFQESTSPNSAFTSESRPEASPENSKIIQVKSPMIGTFYRSPHPDAPPFVEVGDIVEPGKVLCIIEAMKLMNEIKAEIKGKIIEVLINNGDPVEFGQPLFLIEKL